MLAKSSSACSRLGLAQMRNLCESVQIDMVCRQWSCKVKDLKEAHKMDVAFEDFLDAAAEVEGCAGASRMVCGSHGDYKLILKFEDAAAHDNFMESHHASLNKTYMPTLTALAVDGKIDEQSFICERVAWPRTELPGCPHPHRLLVAPQMTTSNERSC